VEQVVVPDKGAPLAIEFGTSGRFFYPDPTKVNTTIEVVTASCDTLAVVGKPNASKPDKVVKSAAKDEGAGTRDAKEQLDFIVGGGRFIFDVAAEVVVRMGGRPKSSAQRRSARVLAGRIMKEHGHRPMHVIRDLPQVLLLIATPTRMEALVDRFLERDLTYDSDAEFTEELVPRRSHQD
jgi:hypothetical protein